MQNEDAELNEAIRASKQEAEDAAREDAQFQEAIRASKQEAENDAMDHLGTLLGDMGRHLFINLDLKSPDTRALFHAIMEKFIQARDECYKRKRGGRKRTRSRRKKGRRTRSKF